MIHIKTLIKYSLFCVLIAISLNFECNCIVGDDTTSILVYNRRNSNILLRYKYSDSGDFNFSEEKLEVKPHDMTAIGGTAKVKPISEYLDYLIIKDKNNNNIMNLSGNTLDSAFKIVEETEYHITYRLDVN